MFVILNLIFLFFLYYQEITSFKQRHVEKYIGEIKEFEDNIEYGKSRVNTLKIFNESPFLSNVILERNKSYLEHTITDITMIAKKTSSNSFIFRAKYDDKPCFIKSFSSEQKNLMYEQLIYKYIKTRDERIKPYYEQYFVKVYDVLKVKNSVLREFLNDKNVQVIRGVIRNHWTLTELDSVLFNPDKFIYMIFTEDIGGITYSEFLNKNYNNEKLFTDTIFDMVYGIYLMNNKLKLMHNDNHFGNVLIKMDLPDTECKYQIESIEYTKIKNFRLCFYDFDLSFLKNNLNPTLDSEWFAQNKASAKDIWTLLNSLTQSVKYNPEIPKLNKEYIINHIFNEVVSDEEDYWSGVHDFTAYKNLDFYPNIVKLILNNSETNINFLKKIYLETIYERKFWNAYCVDNIQNPCVIPDDTTTYPLPVLNRFLSDDKIIEILEFRNLDTFYKKYLKYKTKYLYLKKINNKK